jgi:predicted ATPase
VNPKRQTLFISYPENYLHPKTQVELGDLAILINRSRDSVWMTNSEHMILRLLRRIRETTKGEVCEHPLMGKVTLSKDDVKIIHMPQDVTLKIDEEGEFIDHWPDGFFDERIKELF